MYLAEEFGRFATGGRPRLHPSAKRAFPDMEGISDDLLMAADADTATITLGTQPNASPLSKPPTKKKMKTGQGSKGKRPNVAFLAMTEMDLSMQENYTPLRGDCDLSLTVDSVLGMPAEQRQLTVLDCLPQRSELWLALRNKYLTGTSLSTALGFNEQCAMAALGSSSYLVAHDKITELVHRLRNGTAAPPAQSNVAMDWGTLHEPNCKITAMQHLTDMQLREVGMAEVRFSTLPASFMAGVDMAVLPRLGASPDGVAVLGPESCRLIRDATSHVLLPGTKVLFEAKCKSAFVGGEGGTYTFTGSNKTPPKQVAPHWYAQLQLGMMAADVYASVLAVYGTGSTMMVCVPRDDVWCNMMLKAVQWLMTTYVHTDALPPPDFSKSMPQYAEFMKLTKKKCNVVVKKVLMVSSVNNTTAGLVWLDGTAANLPCTL
jgi:hypothetical protein